MLKFPKSRSSSSWLPVPIFSEGPKLIRKRKNSLHSQQDNCEKVYETQDMESSYVEITIKKRNWVILFAYIPPSNNTLKLFFDETT